MNPNSNYYLAINTGFPNTFDKANDRDGTFPMVHGDLTKRSGWQNEPTLAPSE